jgi:uncharacterized lipoprotein YddW (UPF0748 family)
MLARPPRLRLLHGSLVVLAVLAALAGTGVSAVEPDQRVAWLPAAAVQSRDGIARAIGAASETGTTIVVLPLAQLERDTPAEIDVVAEVLRQAGERKLRVFAELKAGLVAPGGVLPASREHVVYQHPEWLMVPREIATEMLAIDVRSPQYLGRLLRWTRANAGRVEGLYLSPLHTEAAAFIASSVQQLLRDHAFDGVQLDAMAYPGGDFDYSRQAMDVLRREVRAGLLSPARVRMDEVSAIDPFGYATEFPDAWRLLRQTRLTALTARLRTAVRAARPQAMVTVNVTDPEAAERERFQDWRTWLDNGFVDAVARRTRTTGTLLFTADHVMAPAPLTSAPASAPAPTRGVTGS